MNVQPIFTGFVTSKYSNNKPQAKHTDMHTTSPSFKGEDDNLKISNSLKALALSSIVAMSPALQSCDKEDCTHPNHNPLPPVTPPTENPDPDIKGKTYELPEYKLNMFKVSKDTIVSDTGESIIKNDTLSRGSVSFPKGYVYVPGNARDKAEFQTVQKIVNALGLKSSSVSTEYVSTKFAAEELPVQFIWQNEETGQGNRLRYNGLATVSDGIEYDLTEFTPDAGIITKKMTLKSVDSNKIVATITNAADKSIVSESLFDIADGKVSQFIKGDNGSMKETYIYTKSDKDDAITRKTVATGETTTLSNFNIQKIIPID